MAKTTKRPKRPRDAIGAAVKSMRVLTGEDRDPPPKPKKKAKKKR